MRTLNMKTMIQTFVVEESKELIYDSEKIDEWKEKCAELGLEAQLKLAKPDKSPVPFECMNTVQLRVYETMCPARQEYKKYGRTAIPLEVLSLIALSEKENYFDKIEIWFDDKAPDPIAVGCIKQDDGWSWFYYPIARWGDVLRDFEQLKNMAIGRYFNSQTITLTGKIADLQSKLTHLATNTQRYFDAQVEQYEVIGF